MTKKRKSLIRDVTGFTGAGVALGVGTVIVSKAGGTSVLPALSTAGSMMQPIGVGMMGKHALKNLKKLKY